MASPSARYEAERVADPPRRRQHRVNAIRLHPMTSILLVEDDPAIAQPLIRAIEREGFEVQHVALGRDALDAARDDIDLVLLDLTLPDSDGLDVCRTLREARRRGSRSSCSPPAAKRPTS